MTIAARRAAVAVVGVAAVPRQLNGRQEVALREELDLIGQYLDLLRMRCGERLGVELDVAHCDLLIPRFLLQPPVENTLRHGVARREASAAAYLDPAKLGWLRDAAAMTDRLLLPTMRSMPTTRVWLQLVSMGADGAHRPADPAAPS